MPSTCDAVRVDTDSEMSGLVAHVPAVTDLDDNRVEEDHRIERLQRPLLPAQDLLADLVGDLRDRLVADLGADRGGEMVLDITQRHAAGIERDDHAIARPGAADPWAPASA